MDLLIEKNGKRHKLSQLKVLVTAFEESAPEIVRNSKQIQKRNGTIDFGGWLGTKTIDVEGYYRADDLDEETALRERLFALLNDPDGYYITEMRSQLAPAFESPGESSGSLYDNLEAYPSHKRFFVYAKDIKLDLQGNVGGTVLYKMTVSFETLGLPYGESLPQTIRVNNGIIPYRGTVRSKQLESKFGVQFTAAKAGNNLTITLNGVQFVYTGAVNAGDVFKLFGYEYTRGGLNIVKSTNKAVFELAPNAVNTISASIDGTIELVNVRYLYM